MGGGGGWGKKGRRIMCKQKCWCGLPWHLALVVLRFGGGAGRPGHCRCVFECRPTNAPKGPQLSGWWVRPGAGRGEDRQRGGPVVFRYTTVHDSAHDSGSPHFPVLPVRIDVRLPLAPPSHTPLVKIDACHSFAILAHFLLRHRVVSRAGSTWGCLGVKHNPLACAVREPKPRRGEGWFSVI